MVKNDFDHNIRIRVEGKADKFLEGLTKEKDNSWQDIFTEYRILQEDEKSEWSRRYGEGFIEMWLNDNFEPPKKK